MWMVNEKLERAHTQYLSIFNDDTWEENMNDITLLKAILEHWSLDYNQKRMIEDARRCQRVYQLIDKLCAAQESEEEWDFIIDFLYECQESIDNMSPEVMKSLSTSLSQQTFLSIKRIHDEQVFVHHVIGTIVGQREQQSLSNILDRLGQNCELVVFD